MPTPPTSPRPTTGLWESWQWPWSTKEVKFKPEPAFPSFVYHPPLGVSIAAIFLVTSLVSVLGVKTHARHFKRIPNASLIDPIFLMQQRRIRGIVTSVGDSDGFRLYHTPIPYRIRSLWNRIPLKTRKELKGETVHIRLAGIDAPELPHFGMPGQPHGKSAKEWLTSRIHEQVVYCQIHERDRHQRLVASVYYRPSVLHRSESLANLSLDMLKDGWATTYVQEGAVYGEEGKDRYLEVERKAQAKRVGMWIDGLNLETPAEYKKKYKNVKSKAATKEEKTKLKSVC